MKTKIVFFANALFAFSIGLTSCQKSSAPLAPSNPPITTTLRFNWNDTTVDWSTTSSAVSIRRIVQPEIPDTLYALVGTNDGEASSFLGSLYIGVNISNLNVGSWSNEVHVSAIRYPAPAQVTMGGSDAGPGNHLIISNIHDGMVDGTFQASLIGFGYKVKITEGVFKNVKIMDQDTRQ